MTYSLTLIKGETGKRKDSIALLTKLKKDNKFQQQYGVEIKELLISFGWPDIVLLLKGDNVELLKNAIVVIREKALKNGDNLTTSSMICTTEDEIDKNIKKWGKSVSKL